MGSDLQPAAAALPTMNEYNNGRKLEHAGQRGHVILSSYL